MSSREMLLETRFEWALGHRADDLVDELAALEEKQRRNPHDHELLRDPQVLVRVELHERHLPRIGLRELVDHRGDCAAIRTARLAFASAWSDLCLPIRGGGWPSGTTPNRATREISGTGLSSTRRSCGWSGTSVDFMFSTWDVGTDIFRGGSRRAGRRSSRSTPRPRSSTGPVLENPKSRSGSSTVSRTRPDSSFCGRGRSISSPVIWSLWTSRTRTARSAR